MKKNKSKNETNTIMQPVPSYFWSFLFLSLFSGIISGIMGSYINNTILHLGESETTITSPEEETTDNQENKPVATPVNDSSTQIDNLYNPTELEAENNIIFQFYTKKDSENTSIFDQIYTNEDFVGHGFSVTSDGWIITTLNEKITEESLSELVLFDSNKNTFEIEKIISDTKNNLLFVKTNGKNLPVPKLWRNQIIPSGTPVTLYTDIYTPIKAHIKNNNHYITKGTTLQNADTFYTSLELPSINVKDGNTLLGSPVISNSGYVLGIITNNDSVITAIPTNHLETLLRDVFDNEKIDRNQIGINFIDLAQIKTTNTELLKKGALLTSNANTPAVVKNSIAEKSGLKENDIITHVEKEEINKENTLTELLSQYPLTENITITIIRDGLEQDITLQIISE